MSSTLTLRNRQRGRRVDLRRLRSITAALATELLGSRKYELGIYLVSARQITQLNEQFLQHLGPTDVITFEYSVRPPLARGEAPQPELQGEIVICFDEALSQARRFRTHWTSELTRYIIHGLLHLQGYDDQRPAERRRMKQEENRLLRQISCRFDLRLIAVPRRRRVPKMREKC